MFTYNNENTVALIRDKLIAQLRLWEPGVIPEETKVETGLSYTDSNGEATADINTLRLTITLMTSDMQYVSFGVSKEDFDNLV